MENAFEAKLIGDDTLRSAHAVLQLGYPHLTLQDFRTLRARARENGRMLGLMGMFDRRNYVHAVFRCRKELCLQGVTRLQISDFVVSDMIAYAMLSQMIDALERLGLREGCDQLTVSTPDFRENEAFPMSQALVSRGFSMGAQTLARSFHTM